VELLEHEPDPVRPQRRQCPVVKVVDVETVDAGDARGGPVERADDVQQRGLAGTTRSDDGDQLTRRDRERDAGAREHGRLTVGALEVVEGDHRRGTTTR
jgi:hypothetical protein